MTNKTIYTGSTRKIGNWRITPFLQFVPQDVWIGFYWRRGIFGALTVWICLLPCIPIRLDIWRRAKATPLKDIFKYSYTLVNKDGEEVPWPKTYTEDGTKGQR